MTAGDGASTLVGGDRAEPLASRARPPRAPTPVIPRARVHALIAAGVASGPVTALIAPTGFGKSTAIAEWARSAAAPVWFSVPDGADEVCLTLGVWQALAAAGYGPPHALQRSAGGIAALLDWAASLTFGITIVLDGLENARTGVAAHALAPWIERADARTQARLILTDTGSLRPLLAQTLHRGDCTMIGAAALAMNAEEIVAVAESLGRPLDAATCARTVAHTRGWPALVQLSLQDEPGGSTLATDFLEEHILGRLPTRAREFVMATATAGNFDDELAEAIGFEDAASLRHTCTRLGVPLEEVEGEPALFAWHALVAETASSLLRRSDPDAWRRCHIRVGAHLAPRSPLRAVHHFRAGGDDAAAWDLLADHWVELTVDGHSAAVGRLTTELVANIGETSSGCWIRAACARLAGDPVAAGNLMARARRLPSGDATTAVCARLIAADDEELLAATVERAQSALDAGDVRLHAIPYVVFLQGWTLLRLRRDPIRAARLLESAASQAEACERPILLRRARGNLAFAAAFAGSFTAARKILGSLATDSDTSDWRIFDDGVEAITDGFIRLWTGDFQEAISSLTQVAALSRNPASYSGLARVYQAIAVAEIGSPAEQANAFADLDHVAKGSSRGAPWGGWRQAGRAWLAQKLGDQKTAVRFALEALSHPNTPMAAVFCAIVLRPGSAISALTHPPGT